MLATAMHASKMPPRSKRRKGAKIFPGLVNPGIETGDDQTAPVQKSISDLRCLNQIEIRASYAEELRFPSLALPKSGLISHSSC